MASSSKKSHGKPVSSLRRTGLVKFSNQLFTSEVISRKVNDTFASLDHAQLDSKVRVRYLLSQVREEVKHDATAFHRFLKVLARLDGHARRVSRHLRKELCDPKEGAVVYDFRLSKEDVPVLMKILVGVTHRWHQIGISLGLPIIIVLEDSLVYGRDVSDTVRLHSILCKWIARKFPTVIPATLSNLKRELASELVRGHDFASDLEERFNEAKRPSLPTMDSTLKGIYQPSQTEVEVADGKSTILDVQVARSSELVSYQWMKGDHSLPDDSPYSGAHTDTLVIHPASQGTQGEYTCSISNGSQEVRSEKVILTVSFLPEKKRLINLYSIRAEVPPSSWPPEGADTFINPALIGKKRRGRDNYDYSVRGNMDDIIESKEKVEYQDLFGKFQSAALMLIEGRPGSGKTTLLHKASKDWASRTDVLMNAKMVFLIPLQCLAKGMDESLSNIFKLFYQSKKQRKEISRRMERSDGEGICFLIDGLDQYQPQDKSNSVIYGLIQMTCLPRAMVIVASRPVATATLRHQAPVTKRVEILGFRQEQVFKYIDQFPFNTGISNLRAHLDLYRNVLHMCYLPVHAAMICYLYEDGHGSIPRTETKIYENFTIFIILRKLRLGDEYAQLDSLEELSGQDKEYFTKVCRLAFDMTTHSKQVVHQRDTPVPLSRRPGPNDAPSLGLVTIDNTAERYGLDGMYTFLHLTFQEYLAAFHVTKLDEEQQMEMITLYAGEEHMQVVWKFYCGMVTFEDKADQLKQIMRSGRRVRMYKVQCAFESQQAVVCDHALAVETGVLEFSGSTLTPADLTALAYTISNTTHPVTKLHMNGCHLPTNHVGIFLREISNSKLKCMQTLNLNGNDIGDHDATGLAEGLKYCSNLLTLDFSSNKIGDRGATALAGGLKSCLQILDLGNNEIGDDGATGLAEGLKSCSILQILDLSSNKIGDGGTTALAEGLKSCSNLTTLYLHDNNIGDHGASGLAEVLKSCSNLQTLNLHSNNIGDYGAIGLAEVLKSCSNLQTLYLHDNNIGHHGATDLAEGLKSCSNLQVLYLSINKIGDRGASGLAEGLKSCSKLQTLVLSCNKIGDHGAYSLAEVLKSCSKLQTLNLHSNNIGYHGTIALAEGLKSCSNLQTLYLYNNNIGDNGAIALAEGLKSCSNLQTLYIRYNNIDDRDATALADLKTRNARCLN